MKAYKFRLMTFVKGYTVIDFRNIDKFEQSVTCEHFILDFRGMDI